MVNADAVVLTVSIQTADLAAFFVGFWIAAACNDNASCCTVMEFHFAVCQIFVPDCFHDVNQVTVEKFHNNLSFRVAEAAVVFNHIWALWSQHQTEVQTAGECSAQFAHCFYGWQEDAIHALLCNFCSVEWVWCDGAHTAGVQTFVIVQCAFVVHGGNHWFYGFTVNKCQNGNFRTGEEFFHNDLVAACTEDFVFHDFMDAVFCFLQVFRDDNAFTQSKTIRFDNHWEFVGFLHVLHCFYRIGEHFVSSSWNAKLLHHVFGEYFGAFDFRSQFLRAKGFDTSFVEGINHTCCQWVIRSYEDPIHCFFFCVFYDTLYIHCVNCNTGSISSNTAVARCAENLRIVFAFFQLADDRVFTTTGADD